MDYIKQSKHESISFKHTQYCKISVTCPGLFLIQTPVLEGLCPGSLYPGGLITGGIFMSEK